MMELEQAIKFRVGTYELHEDSNFNYQLNRIIGLNGGNIEEIKAISSKIKDIESWEREIYNLGEKALAEGRISHAIAYFRMTEFFMFQENPKKIDVYQRSRELFYKYHEKLFENGTITRKKISYDDKFLPVWISHPKNKPVKDIILIHGGYDSLIEEFLEIFLYLQQQGFAVYMFEGPGQGEVIREEHLPFTVNWEKPVSRILNEFKLEEVTLIGMSLGGTLALRAAAFEKRIKRVISWGGMPNFRDVVLSRRGGKIMRFFLRLKAKRLINYILKKVMKRDPMAKWGINHGMYNMDVNTPYDYLVNTDKFQIGDIADLVDQDSLILASSQDHFLELEFHTLMVEMLKNVRSMTYRLFTQDEKAENHCGLGNVKLVLDTIMNWIEMIKKRT